MPTLAELPYPLLAATAVALGLAFGSFLNVVVYRLPRGQSVSHPGSRCPGCGKPIAPYDNIPVVSWLVLRGKARCCGARISPRYPSIELLGGLLAWAILELVVLALAPETPIWRAVLVFGVYLALGLGLIAAAFIDLEHMVLPDEITVGGSLLGIASVPIRHNVDWLQAVVGGLVGFLVVWLPFDLFYRWIRGQPGMGMGDAKLVMLAGVWFGWQGALFTLMAGAVQGTLFALVILLVKGRIEEPDAVREERAQMQRELEAAEGEERRRLLEELEKDPIFQEPEAGFGRARLAFGPFLILAILEYMLFGELLVSDYLLT